MKVYQNKTHPIVIIEPNDNRDELLKKLRGLHSDYIFIPKEYPVDPDLYNQIVSQVSIGGGKICYYETMCNS